MKPKPNRMISRAAMMLLTVLMAFAGAQTAWADAWTDKGGTGGSGTTGDPYYVNMPTKGTTTLDLSDGSITTFKVYDDGGVSGNYSANCEGFLVITAPTGYKISLAGSGIYTENGYDWLKVYNDSDPDHLGEPLEEICGADKSIGTR